jgi:hypothetical protein
MNKEKHQCMWCGNYSERQRCCCEACKNAYDPVDSTPWRETDQPRAHDETLNAGRRELCLTVLSCEYDDVSTHESAWRYCVLLLGFPAL